MESDRAQADLGLAADISLSEEKPLETKTPKKRFVGRRPGLQSNQSNGESHVAESREVEGAPDIDLQAATYLIYYSCSISENCSSVKSSTSRNIEQHRHK